MTLEPEKMALLRTLPKGRDYGTRTYEEVRDGVLSGEIEIWEGISGPHLRYRGQPIKGTFPVARPRDIDARQVAIQRFLEKANDDFESVYASLIELCTTEKDPRALKIFFEHFLGAPIRVERERRDEVIDKLLDRLLSTPSNEVRDLGVIEG